LAEPTYDLIEFLPVNSQVSSITVNSLPTQDANGNTYRDLIIKAIITATSSTGYQLKLNGGGDNYNVTRMITNGSTLYAQTGTDNDGMDPYLGFVATTPSHVQLTIADYQETNSYQVAILEGGLTELNPQAGITFFQSNNLTAAITSLEFTCSDFTSGSSIAIYGVVK